MGRGRNCGKFIFAWYRYVRVFLTRLPSPATFAWIISPIHAIKIGSLNRSTDRWTCTCTSEDRLFCHTGNGISRFFRHISEQSPGRGTKSRHRWTCISEDWLFCHWLTQTEFIWHLLNLLPIYVHQVRILNPDVGEYLHTNHSPLYFCVVPFLSIHCFRSNAHQEPGSCLPRACDSIVKIHSIFWSQNSCITFWTTVLSKKC